jgi:hypothetical protein
MEMTATPLTDIRLPKRARTELSSVTVDAWIHDHAITVGRPWWKHTLAAHLRQWSSIPEFLRVDSFQSLWRTPGVSYQLVPSSPGITHRPSAATRPITMLS